MEQKPFSFKQAEEIADDFEDLIDTEIIAKNGNYLAVTHVVTSPYNEEQKEIFAKRLVLEDMAPNELLQAAATREYDVIVISQDEEDNGIYDVIDIRSYIEQNGIRYNFPED